MLSLPTCTPVVVVAVWESNPALNPTRLSVVENPRPLLIRGSMRDTTPAHTQLCFFMQSNLMPQPIPWPVQSAYLFQHIPVHRAGTG